MKDRLILSAPCYNFLEGLVTQIARGLRGHDGQTPEYLEAMKGTFAKACLRDDIPLAHSGSVPFKLPNRLLELQRAYVKWLDDERTQFTGAVLYPIVNLLPELEKSVKKSRKLFRPATVKEKQTGLERAIATAEDNIGRTSDRIAALRFLDAVWGMHGWPNRGAEEAYGTAYTALWKRRSDFYRDLMQLVLVQGDLGRIEQLRKDVYKQYLAPGISVMHLLETDGNQPGHWYSDDEDAFRSDMKAAIETPLSVDA